MLTFIRVASSAVLVYRVINLLELAAYRYQPFTEATLSAL